MNNASGARANGKKKYSKILLILTTVYGILYLVLMISSLFEGPFDLERMIAYLAFVIFLPGYYYSWRNERVAGIIFIAWWGVMWYLGFFVAEQDRGVGVVMGVPLFIIAIFQIISWYRKNGGTISESTQGRI